MSDLNFTSIGKFITGRFCRVVWSQNAAISTFYR